MTKGLRWRLPDGNRDRGGHVDRRLRRDDTGGRIQTIGGPFRTWAGPATARWHQHSLSKRSESEMNPTCRHLLGSGKAVVAATALTVAATIAPPVTVSAEVQRPTSSVAVSLSA